MRLTRAARLLSVAGVVAVVYACRAPTEMTIRVTTTIPCKTLKGVGIAAAPTSADAEHRAETRFYAAETMQCDSDSVVGTLVMTPGASSFSVIVVAGVDSDVTSCVPPDYKGCIVARRRLAFVDHKSLEVPIALTRDCLDVPCNTDTSCVHGDCKSVETTCNDASCTQVGVSPEGDGGGEDGGGLDGGSSASPSCPPPPGTAAPCTCSGAVRVDAGGVTQTTQMFVDCQRDTPRCNCLIDGQVANTIPNMNLCSQSQFGSCCTH